ncbi:zinc dependent phospholipase C family protein|uniref:Phospholipase C n=1 Tax=Dendrosporobacter quercicolus TaxID=146817 RepID=A0A1G9UYI3_9FIRM|nr:zinc dependent phospholipase C family protein [Dendrosporobacter quercicolus]NSL47991.1 zinc dependent phospholipase C family protein [Dendrosporobacter quercicolus DSM 1736]SDM64725.1 phospholipase C [Dendrosporobacter quercicolus]
MSFPALGNASMLLGAKVLLAAVSPLQGFFDQPGIAHEFCNRQAVTILARDGNTGYARLLSTYMTELNAGVYWADKGWKNVGHYYEPVGGRGLWQFSNALESFNSYYYRCLTALGGGKIRDAVFFLGAAAHLLQDLCVPHHARAKVFNGHKEYEGWVKAHYFSYAVDRFSGFNCRPDNQRLLLDNAAMAADLYDLVDSERGNARYHEVTAIALPQAQRATARLFEQFCQCVQSMASFKLITVA